MDTIKLVNYYKMIFKNPKDVLDWIERDLILMGLGDEEIEKELTDAQKYLGV